MSKKDTSLITLLFLEGTLLLPYKGISDFKNNQTFNFRITFDFQKSCKDNTESPLCSVTQLCLTLFDSMDCSSPGSSIHGILQARILEWVSFPPSGDLPDPGIKPRFPALEVDSLPAVPPGKPTNTIDIVYSNLFDICFQQIFSFLFFANFFLPAF